MEVSGLFLLNNKHIIFLFIFFSLLLSPTGVASPEIILVHPHFGNTYWIGADGNRITLVNNPSAVNPTYGQLFIFLVNDKTDEMKYEVNRFTCGDYAEEVHNNAERAGYKAGWVSLEGIDHSCNVFNTTDRGLIFVDCTGSPEGRKEGDTTVDVQIGEEYRPKSIYSYNSYYYSLGIVEDYIIYW